MSTPPIGYLIVSDFSNGTLIEQLRPAFFMIKAGNCKFCQITEPAFRAINERPRNFNMFFLRPFDGKEPREQATRNILYSIVETEDFGFPTFVFVALNGEKSVHVGSMSMEDMIEFIKKGINKKPEPVAPLSSTSKAVPDFRPYNV